METHLITARQAAAELSVTTQWIGTLIRSGWLKGQRIGRWWLVDRRSLVRARTRPGRGRPPKLA